MKTLLLLCMIAGRRVAIQATRVLSVIEIDAVTPIPATPSFIVGLAALRSQVVTVIDCRVLLGFSANRRDPGCRAAVIEFEGHRYALLVDEAFDVVEALTDPVAMPGGFGAGWEGVAQGMVETQSGPAVLIDVEHLLRGPEHVAAA